MESWTDPFVSESKQDPIRRLCWLHFVHLRAEDGLPLVRLEDVLVQCLAVILHDRQGGRADNARRQHQYFLGRAATTIWGKHRQVADGTKYNREERRELQRRPKLFQQAHSEVFIKAGICRVVAKLQARL